MAKEKGMPLGTFLKRFSSEAQCQEHLASLRWQNGYVCPKCGCRQGYRLSNGRYQCNQLSAPVIKCKKTPRKKCSFMAEEAKKR